MGQKNLPTIRANRVNFDLKQPKSRLPTTLLGVKISLIAEVMKISRHMCSMQLGLTSIVDDPLSFV